MLALLVTGAMQVLDALMHFLAGVFPHDPIGGYLYDVLATVVNVKSGLGYALFFTPLGSIFTFCVAWLAVKVAAGFATAVVSFLLDHFTIAV